MPSSKRRDSFSALADPTRRGVLELLLERDTLTAGEIASRFPRVSRAAVSKHLRVLREARLVTSQELGRERHYRLEAGPLAEQRAWLEQFAPVWEDSLSELKRRVEGGRRTPR